MKRLCNVCKWEDDITTECNGRASSRASRSSWARVTCVSSGTCVALIALTTLRTSWACVANSTWISQLMSILHHSEHQQLSACIKSTDTTDTSHTTAAGTHSFQYTLLLHITFFYLYFQLLKTKKRSLRRSLSLLRVDFNPEKYWSIRWNWLTMKRLMTAGMTTACCTVCN